jgi:hypothetical protein
MMQVHISCLARVWATDTQRPDWFVSRTCKAPNNYIRCIIVRCPSQSFRPLIYACLVRLSPQMIHARIQQH